jgi:preprotein translocase subunit YajC
MFISTAFAQSAGPSMIASQLLPFVLIFGVFYLMLIRPQQKRAKQHKEMVSKLSRGDKVIISSGITGIVSKAVAEKDTIEVEIATGVYVNLLRANVTTVLDNNSTISLPQKAPAKKSLQKTKKS